VVELRFVLAEAVAAAPALALDVAAIVPETPRPLAEEPGLDEEAEDDTMLLPAVATAEGPPAPVLRVEPALLRPEAAAGVVPTDLPRPAPLVAVVVFAAVAADRESPAAEA
jgi:hypothetical protein